MAYFHCRIRIRTRARIPVLYKYYGKGIQIWIRVSGNMLPYGLESESKSESESESGSGNKPLHLAPFKQKRLQHVEIAGNDVARVD